MFMLLVRTIVVPRCNEGHENKMVAFQDWVDAYMRPLLMHPIQIQLLLVINGVDMLSFIECNSRFLFACILFVY